MIGHPDIDAQGVTDTCEEGLYNIEVTVIVRSMPEDTYKFAEKRIEKCNLANTIDDIRRRYNFLSFSHNKDFDDVFYTAKSMCCRHAVGDILLERKAETFTVLIVIASM